jgi:hypothetical protein
MSDEREMQMPVPCSWYKFVFVLNGVRFGLRLEGIIGVDSKP